MSNTQTRTNQEIIDYYLNQAVQELSKTFEYLKYKNLNINVDGHNHSPQEALHLAWLFKNQGRQDEACRILVPLASTLLDMRDVVFTGLRMHTRLLDGLASACGYIGEAVDQPEERLKERFRARAIEGVKDVAEQRIKPNNEVVDSDDEDKPLKIRY